ADLCTATVLLLLNEKARNYYKISSFVNNKALLNKLEYLGLIEYNSSKFCLCPRFRSREPIVELFYDDMPNVFEADEVTADKTVHLTLEKLIFGGINIGTQ